MTTIEQGNERLLKLAEHLETGKLGHSRFSFAVINELDNGQYANNQCGTLGCAMGECPIVWPNEWRFHSKYQVGLNKTGKDAFESCQSFFALGTDEVFHLFYPEDQNVEKFGGKLLSESATKEEVASNIRAFVALRQSKTL